MSWLSYGLVMVQKDESWVMRFPVSVIMGSLIMHLFVCLSVCPTPVHQDMWGRCEDARREVLPGNRHCPWM